MNRNKMQKLPIITTRKVPLIGLLSGMYSIAFLKITGTTGRVFASITCAVKPFCAWNC